MLHKGKIFLLVLILSFSIYATYSVDEAEFVKMVKGTVAAIDSSGPLPTENIELKNLQNEKSTDFGKFDFIIVGGGSAGTLLTNRLTEIKQWKILLLEAGENETRFSEIPGIVPYLFRSEMNWGYFSTPQKSCCLGMKNQQCIIPRGKVLGGSSTINVKMYVRGNREDYDHWHTLGNKGWSYRRVLPYFIKTENSTIPNRDPGYHRTGGLLHVQYIERSEFTTSFLRGEKELGVPILDYNGVNQIGASPIQFTIDGLKIASGKRAFIDPIKNSRKNLNITLKAFVTKVIIDHNKIARGVEFVKDKKKYRAWADKEVILSAGSYNSPQILMLSGIGPANELKKHHIKIVQNLPVGENLQEHPAFLGFIVRTNKTVAKKSLEESVINYLHGHRPLIAPMNSDSTVFTKLSSKSIGSDIQTLLNVPPGYGDQFTSAFNLDSNIANSLKENYKNATDLILMIILLHQQSKGTVKLKSNDPKYFPLINYRLFSDPKNTDIDTMHQGIMKNFELLETQPFQELNATFIPIDAGCGSFNKYSKSYWHCMIRHMSATIYHPMGTVRMGRCSQRSVVSNHLRVHGVKNLRVIDASVIPWAPSGNINAVVYMIAEKAADLIKRHYKVD